MDLTVSQIFLELVLQEAHFFLKKLNFPNWQSILVPDFPEKLQITGAIVLVNGSQVWSEPRAISVPGSKFFELGMLI